MKTRYPHSRASLQPGHAGLILCAVLLLASPRMARSQQPLPLKDAKLNIEHNATDNDTGFQGFIDSEGWQKLEVSGPEGVVLTFEGKGKLATLGVTELFFETVEPANDDLPLEEMLAKLPVGNYTIRGPRMENGESGGDTAGTAWLTHDIPAGPQLQTPAEDAVITTPNLKMKWGAVDKTIKGGPVKIIAYQLIVEKDEAPQPHMIGKFGLSMYLPPTVTSVELPKGFLQSSSDYQWEVLAIEESGNQTLSSRAFRTGVLTAMNSRIKEASLSPGKQLVIHVDAFVGEDLALYSSADLVDWSTLEATLKAPAEPPSGAECAELTWMSTNPVSGHRFYRLAAPGE